MSKYIGGILKENFNVPSVEDEQWSSTSYYYHHMINTAEFVNVESIDKYLEMLRGPTVHYFHLRKGRCGTIYY